MACWAMPSETSNVHAFVSLCVSGGTARFVLGHNASGASVASATNSSNTTASGVVGVASSGSWGHYGASYASSTSRVAYYNGIDGTANTTAITVSGVNRTLIGSRVSAGAYGLFHAGRLADIAIWNTVLTPAEWSKLANGACPIFIRPESLVFYNPLDDRWTYDRARGLFLSDVGPTGAAEDPPFLQKPRRKYFLFGDIAAPASVIFRNRTGSRSRLIA